MSDVMTTVRAGVSNETGLPAGGKSAARVLHMLSVFQGATGPLGLTELARRAGLPKSTAFRLLATLEGSGYLERRGPDYLLSGHLLELGHQARTVRHGRAVELIYPYLCELFASSRTPAGYATLLGDRALIVESVGSLLREPQVSLAASAALLRSSGRCSSAAELVENGVSILSGEAGEQVFIAPQAERQATLELAIAVEPHGERPGALVLAAGERTQLPALAGLLRSAARHFSDSRRVSANVA